MGGKVSKVRAASRLILPKKVLSLWKVLLVFLEPETVFGDQTRIMLYMADKEMNIGLS